MKKLYILLVAFSMLFAGCKKDSDEGSSNSTWTINGKTYTAAKTIYSVADDALGAAASDEKNAIILYFEEKPTESGAYTVVPYYRLGATGGDIHIEIFEDGKNQYFTSTQNGDYATISILSGGRLKVTFKNVTFVDESNNQVKASGTIIEE